MHTPPARRHAPRTAAKGVHKLLVGGALRHAGGIVLGALALIGQHVVRALHRGEALRVAALVRMLLGDEVAVAAADLCAGVAARRLRPALRVAGDAPSRRASVSVAVRDTPSTA